MLDFRTIETNHPNSFRLFNTQYHHHRKSKLYDFFDENHVRVFVGYAESGGFKVTVYRKYTETEFKKEFPDKDITTNWKMKRIGIIQSFQTRAEAECKGFEVAFGELEFLLENDGSRKLTLSPYNFK